jgi:predicted glycosyltransferase
MKVIIVVTHLLGTGHLARALTLARAYLAAGHSVSVVSGGMPAPQLDRGDVELVQLPPVKSDGVNFTTLLDTQNAHASDRMMAERTSQLLDHLATQEPDILITELFPFGRRILRDEFETLLKAAHDMATRPLICASIRDILAPPSKPKKAVLADMFIDTFYDAVLVHSDRDVTPLTLSWPVSETLAPKLQYTGFVAPPAPSQHPQTVGLDEVIVSAGGGDVGAHIFKAALSAARDDPNRRWRILMGGADAKNRSAALGDTAPPNVTIEPARPDFRQMLHHAAASVSMCGYNTALDILQTGCPAVFIPFDAGNEVEQGLRADALVKLPGISVLRSADLAPENLGAAILEVTKPPRRAARLTGFNGAQETVTITTQLREDMHAP